MLGRLGRAGLGQRVAGAVDVAAGERVVGEVHGAVGAQLVGLRERALGALRAHCHRDDLLDLDRPALFCCIAASMVRVDGLKFFSRSGLIRLSSR